MGLYSSFSTSQYYDDEPVSEKKSDTVVEKKVKDYKKPHQEHNMANDYGLTNKKRKSLYEESKIVESDDKPKVNFNETYRVGQMVRIAKPNGKVTTRKGRIIEIVAKDLMYVAMEDSHKDVHDQWLIDFVKAEDTIEKI